MKEKIKREKKESYLMLVCLSLLLLAVFAFGGDVLTKLKLSKERLVM